MNTIIAIMDLAAANHVFIGGLALGCIGTGVAFLLVDVWLESKQWADRPDPLAPPQRPTQF